MPGGSGRRQAPRHTEEQLEELAEQKRREHEARQAPRADAKQIEELRQQRKAEREAKQAKFPESVRDRPEEPAERVYRVVGDMRVGGKRKGEVVALSHTDAQDAWMIESGHLEPFVEEESPVVEETTSSEEVSKPANRGRKVKGA